MFGDSLLNPWPAAVASDYQQSVMNPMMTVVSRNSLPNDALSSDQGGAVQSAFECTGWSVIQ